MPYTYEYPRLSLTVDVIITRINNQHKEILLIRRRKYPFQNKWALPGGFVNMDERLADAARRELLEETGLSVLDLIQFHTFDEPERDPRDRTITVVFTGTVSSDNSSVNASSDASEAMWFPLNELPELAFDHYDIIRLAILLDRI